mmetsp:Transcript_12868/g.32935  ORF Transcript_12868/g.32935 Transcript_12868/m.32935 type:complete len:244 (-) Transcript_12868:364-1095(-)
MSMLFNVTLDESAAAKAVPTAGPILLSKRMSSVKELLAQSASAIARPPAASSRLLSIASDRSVEFECSASARAAPPSGPNSLSPTFRRSSTALMRSAAASATAPPSPRLLLSSRKSVRALFDCKSLPMTIPERALMLRLERSRSATGSTPLSSRTGSVASSTRTLRIESLMATSEAISSASVGLIGSCSFAKSASRWSCLMPKRNMRPALPACASVIAASRLKRTPRTQYARVEVDWNALARR